MKLIAGLGNPGREYVGTRHNVGFDVIDALAHRLGLVAATGDFVRLARQKFSALTLEGAVALTGGGSEKVLLIKPMTFMNLSGRAVQQAMAFYQLRPDEVMIALDDVALPCGRLRIRAGGSDGGHNGLKDIQRALGTNQYPRLRMGIDAPPQFVPQKDYVLGRFSEAQQKLMMPAVERAASAIQCWIEYGIESAMNQFNALSPAEATEPRQDQ